MLYRFAEDEDMNEMIEILKEGYAMEYGPSGFRKDWIIDHLIFQNKNWYLMENKEMEMIGVCCFEMKNSIGTLTHLAIKTKYQRKGFGIQFIKTVECIWKTMECSVGRMILPHWTSYNLVPWLNAIEYLECAGGFYENQKVFIKPTRYVYYEVSK